MATAVTFMHEVHTQPHTATYLQRLKQLGRIHAIEVQRVWRLYPVHFTRLQVWSV